MGARARAPHKAIRAPNPRLASLARSIGSTRDSALASQTRMCSASRRHARRAVARVWEAERQRSAAGVVPRNQTQPGPRHSRLSLPVARPTSGMAYREQTAKPPTGRNGRHVQSTTIRVASTTPARRSLGASASSAIHTFPVPTPGGTTTTTRVLNHLWRKRRQTRLTTRRPNGTAPEIIGCAASATDPPTCNAGLPLGRESTASKSYRAIEPQRSIDSPTVSCACADGGSIALRSDGSVAVGWKRWVACVDVNVDGWGVTKKKEYCGLHTIHGSLRFVCLQPHKT